MKTVPLQLIFLVFAFVCFAMAALWNPTPNPYHPRLVAAGLAFFIASQFASSFQ